MVRTLNISITRLSDLTKRFLSINYSWWYWFLNSIEEWNRKSTSCLVIIYIEDNVVNDRHDNFVIECEGAERQRSIKTFDFNSIQIEDHKFIYTGVYDNGISYTYTDYVTLTMKISNPPMYSIT